MSIEIMQANFQIYWANILRVFLQQIAGSLFVYHSVDRPLCSQNFIKKD